MELLKAIAMRKSTRSYQSEQISDISLNSIINAGCAAPVGMGAYDSIHFTVIQNPDLLNRIIETATNIFNKPKVNLLYGAPTLIIISCKPIKGFPNSEYANSACIIENMALAATDMGIGSVYLWGILQAFHKDSALLKALNLPAHFTPISSIALGYPTIPLSLERELKQTIKVNTIQ